jgi:hypothetical protein
MMFPLFVIVTDPDEEASISLHKPEVLGRPIQARKTTAGGVSCWREFESAAAIRRDFGAITLAPAPAFGPD